MDNRKEKILDDLLNATGYIHALELANKYHVTTRTIRNDIQSLNKELNSHNDYIERDNHYGYIILEKNKNHISQYMNKEFYQMRDFFPSTPLQRQAYMALSLLFSDIPLTLDSFAEQLYISKSTAKGDMDHVLFQLKDMYIAASQTRKGTLIEAPEDRKRILASYFLMYDIAEPRMMCMIFKMMSGIDLMDVYDQLLAELSDILIEHQVRIKDIDIQLFLVNCMIARVRNQDHPMTQEGQLDNPIILELRQAINPVFELPLGEWKILEKEFVQRTLNKVSDEDKVLAISFMQDFLSVISKEYQLFIPEHESELLLKEIGMILSRARLSIMNKNIYLGEIVAKYPYAFEVALNLRSLIQNQNLYVPIDDIATIALIIERAIQYSNKSLHITICSELGNIVLENLKDHIHHMIDYNNITFKLYNQYELRYMILHDQVKSDLVISTNNKLKYFVEEHDIDYVFISPFLNIEDLDHLNKKINELLRKQKNISKEESLLSLEKEISYEPAQDLFEYTNHQSFTIKHSYYLKEGLLMVKLNRSFNSIRVVPLIKSSYYNGQFIQVILEYSNNPIEKTKDASVYTFIELIAKSMTTNDLKNCKTKEKLLSILHDHSF